VRLLWHPSLSLASGDEVLALLDDCRAGRVAVDVLCVEGAMLRGPTAAGASTCWPAPAGR
jgi:Ni,Fe-hydrogenase I small subunit